MPDLDLGQIADLRQSTRESARKYIIRKGWRDRARIAPGSRRLVFSVTDEQVQLMRLEAAERERAGGFRPDVDDEPVARAADDGPLLRAERDHRQSLQQENAALREQVQRLTALLERVLSAPIARGD